MTQEEEWKMIYEPNTKEDVLAILEDENDDDLPRIMKIIEERKKQKKLQEKQTAS